MNYSKYALALLCSVSLTSCWPASEKTEKNENKTTTTRAVDSVRHIRAESDFTRAIKSGNVVVDFYADWCGPCKRLGPIIGDLAKEFSNVNFIKVDIDSSSIGNRYSVRSIPTLIFFKNGKQVKRISGYQSKSELRSILKSTF